MANNPYVNKVQTADGTTIMDISGDTVTPSDVLNGVTFHSRSGAAQQGNLITHNVYDGLDSSSTSDALSANQGKVLNQKIADIFKIDTFTGTTSANGNVSRQLSNKYIVLSAFTTTGGVIVSPYPGAGSDEHGQYTWWFNCYTDSSGHPVYANKTVTINFVYIEI